MNLSEYHFTTQINSFLASKITLDADYVVADFDQGCREFFGEYMNLPFPETGFNEEAKEELSAFFEEVKKNGSARVATMVTDRHDAPHFVDISGTYRPDEDGCYAVSVFDIPDMEDDVIHFRNNMWKYRLMLGMSDLIFFDYDIDDDIAVAYRYVGKKSVRLIHGPFADFEKAVREYAEQSDNNLIQVEKFLAALTGRKNVFEVTFRSGLLHIDHKMQKLHIRGRYDDISGHKCMYAVINNLNEKDEDIPFYMTSAGMDSATGLLNKRSIIEYTEDILINPATASRGHYMVLLDIDDFKAVNDNYGHQVGDEVIALLANTLDNVVGDAGILGRYGGDEFYIFTDMIWDEPMLRAMLRNIRGTFELRAKDQLGIPKLTLSMGVSTYPDNAKTFNDLLFFADKALYIAKEKGKDRYVIYRPEVHDAITTGAERKGFSSYSEQSKAVNHLVRELYADGKSSIAKNLDFLCKSFDLDGIEIFFGKQLDKMYSAGKNSLKGGANVFVKNEKYVQKFDETGVYALNNYNNLKKSVPELYDYMHNNRCFSAVQVALPSAKEPIYFCNFFVMNRNHQWNEAEKSALSLCGSLIYDVLKK